MRGRNLQMNEREREAEELIVERNVAETEIQDSLQLHRKPIIFTSGGVLFQDNRNG